MNLSSEALIGPLGHTNIATAEPDSSIHIARFGIITLVMLVKEKNDWCRNASNIKYVMIFTATNLIACESALC